MRCPARVLVVSLGGLGDFLTRWPLWQSLRRSFPGATISYLGYPRHAILLAAAGLCDSIIDFERERPGENPPPATRLGDEARRAGKSKIPNPRYEVVISVLGVRGREWVETIRRGAELIEFEPFPPDRSGIPVGEHILRQLRSRGLADPGPPRLVISPEARDWANVFWMERGLQGGTVIALHPGSGGPHKNWPSTKFAALTERLIAGGTAVLALAGEAEGVVPAWPAGVVPVEVPELVRLAAILAKCRGYVGNDCGISHLAALAGIPATVIFGPTDPAVWAPRGERVTVVRVPMPCSPCGREEREGCLERRCLEGIPVEEVLKTIPIWDLGFIR
jgi:ADP-heptose:LPS heptosyltransferase